MEQGDATQTKLQEYSNTPREMYSIGDKLLQVHKYTGKYYVRVRDLGDLFELAKLSVHLKNLDHQDIRYLVVDDRNGLRRVPFVSLHGMIQLTFSSHKPHIIALQHHMLAMWRHYKDVQDRELRELDEFVKELAK